MKKLFQQLRTYGQAFLPYLKKAWVYLKPTAIRLWNNAQPFAHKIWTAAKPHLRKAWAEIRPHLEKAWAEIRPHLKRFLKWTTTNYKSAHDTFMALPKKVRWAFGGSFAAGLLMNLVLSAIASIPWSLIFMNGNKTRPIPVGVDTVVVQDLKKTFATHAYLQPWKEVIIRPNASVTVRDVQVSVGTVVKKGQTLVTLDSELQSLRAELNNIDLQLRNLDFGVTMALAKKNFLSEKEIKQKTLEHRSQEVRARISELEGAEALIAPIDGVVAEIALKNGDYVDNNTNYFVRIVDTNAYKISLYLPQSVASRLLAGDDVALSRMSNDENSSDKIEEAMAHIAAIAPTVDPKTGSVFVEITAEKVPKTWIAGMYVETKMTIEEAPMAIVVPNAAVIYENNMPFVYRIVSEDGREPASDDDEVQHVAKIPVQLGVRDSRFAEISDGLDELDQIVTEGQGGLTDGATVEIIQ